MPTYNPVCKFDITGIGFDVGAFDKTMLTDREAFSTIDTLSTDGEKSVSESLNITDGVHFKIFLSQALQVVDSFTRSVTKSVSESLDIADAITKSGTKLLSEGLNIADTFTKSVIKLLSESFAIGDAIKFRVLLSETLQTVDTIIKSGIKLLSESFSLIDTLKLKELLKEYLSFSESLQIADSFILKSKLKFYETIKIVDSVIRYIFMMIRKITIRVRGGSYESDLELEDIKKEDEDG